MLEAPLVNLGDVSYDILVFSYYFNSFSSCLLLNCDRISVTFIFPVSITMVSLSAEKVDNDICLSGVVEATFITYIQKRTHYITFLPNSTSILG